MANAIRGKSDARECIVKGERALIAVDLFADAIEVQFERARELVVHPVVARARDASGIGLLPVAGEDGLP